METKKFVTAKVVAKNDQSRKKMKRIIPFTITLKNKNFLKIKNTITKMEKQRLGR